VEGRLQIRHYDNNEGKRVYVTEIIAENVRFLEHGEVGQNLERQQQPESSTYTEDKPIDISDDDLPF
jgi:single-strand DNA-binding protein